MIKKLVCVSLFYIILFCAGTQTIVAQKKYILNQITGLKQNSVKAIVEDRNGMVWISTEMGIYRYDGNSYHELQGSFSRKRIKNMIQDKNTGIVYFSVYPENTMYKIVDYKAYKIDNKDDFYNAFYAFEYTHNITNKEQAKKIFDYLKQQKKIVNVDHTIINKDSSIYCSKAKLLMLFDKSGNVSIMHQQLSQNHRLLKFGDSTLLLDKGKAFLLKGNKIDTIKIDVAPELLEESLKSKREYYFFGSEYYFKNNGTLYSIQFENFKLKANLLFEWIANDFSPIHYSNKFKVYFIGSQTKGLYVAKPNYFNSLTHPNDNLNSCYSIAKGKNGVWYNSSGWSFTEKKDKINANPFALTSNIRFVLKYNNEVYYEKDNRFINFISKKQSNSFILKNKLDHINPTSYASFKKQFWLSGTNNLYYLNKDTLVKDAFISATIKNCDILEIKNFNNKLILATSMGSYEYAPHEKQLKSIKGLEKKYARYIKIIDSQSYWIGCYGDGLFLVKNNKAYKVKDRNINISTAHAIEDDKKGNLWITTNEGLLVINKKVALSNTIKNKYIECYRYTVEDGLITNEFNGGCTHPSVRDTDGSFGFPSIKGFIWFYPEKVVQHAFTGKIIIDKVQTEEHVVSLNNNVFRIPATSKLVSIDFSYPYYFNRENLSVEYRLATEKYWHKITGNNFKIIRNQTGRQKLLMRIRTHNKLADDYKTQSFEFEFETRYYEEAWFWGLMLLLFLVILRVAFYFGLHLYKKREKQLQDKISEKTQEITENLVALELSKAELSKSLNEKEMMLKEIHHRVKNNLQIVMSLLSIEAHEGKSKKISDFLEISESRIQSMLLIHQSLYENNQLDSIIFQLYIEQLVANLKGIMGVKVDNINFNIDANNVFINIDTALPLGLVINELLTNTFKHAFPNQQKGEVEIKIYQVSEIEFELIFSDNGVGVDANQNESQSFGMDLIRMLVKQLKGSVYHEPFKGTKYRIPFKQSND